MYKKLPHTIECLSFEPKCSQYILCIVQPTFSVSVYLLCYLLVPTEASILVPTCPASFPGPLDLITNQPIWRNVHIRIPSQETVLSCCLVVMTRTSLNPIDDDLQCLICFLPLREPVLTKCGHRFCRECLEHHMTRFVI